MKVVSDIIVISILEQVKQSSEHLIKVLEISSKVSPCLDMDIGIAKRNLMEINGHIESIKQMGFEAIPKEAYEFLQSPTNKQTYGNVQLERGAELSKL